MNDGRSPVCLTKTKFFPAQKAEPRTTAIPSPASDSISMGGVDLPDVTSQVIQCLDHSQLPKDCHINVVMGASAPWLDKVKAVAATSTLSVQIHVNISEMAELR